MCNWIGMASKHENQAKTWQIDLDEGDDLFSQTKTKADRKEKQPRMFLESLHLNTMAMSYHWHFDVNSKDKKQVT